MQKSDYIYLPLDHGCIDQARINHDIHSRAKNWTAVVRHDPKSPGGLSRNFWTRASGSYVVVDCEPGDVIEFAADYYSSRGRKMPNRNYLRVVSTGYLVDPVTGSGENVLALAPWHEPRKDDVEAEEWLNALAGETVSEELPPRELAISEIRRLMQLHGINTDELG